MTPDRTPSASPTRPPSPRPSPSPARPARPPRTAPTGRALAVLATAALTLALLVASCGSSTPTPAAGSPGPGDTVTPGDTIAPDGSGAPLETPEPEETGAPDQSSEPGESTPPGETPGPSLVLPSGAPTPFDTPPPDYEEETPPPHPTAKPKATPTLTPHVALEKKLPNSIRGVKLVKDSYSGANMPPASDPRTIPTRDLLKNLGAKPANLSVATAADPTGKLSLFLNAIRVAKAPTDFLFSNYLAVLEKYSQRGIEKGTASLGGKKVTTVIDIDQRDQGSKTVMYMYAKGDIIYVVYTDDRALATDALKAMP